MKEEERSETSSMTRLMALGAVALAAILYYVLVLGQHSDKIQQFGGK